MYRLGFKSVSRVLALAILTFLPVSLEAQAAPSAMGPSSSDSSAPKWDFFAGYSFLLPYGAVQVPQPVGGALPFSYDKVTVGGVFSYSRYFSRHFGVQVEVGEHEYGGQHGSNPVGQSGNNDGFMTYSGGLVLRYPAGIFTPFAHVLAGAAYVNGPDYNPSTWGPSATAGGGVDILTPLFSHRFSVRLYQADYEYMHVNFGNMTYGGVASINAFRLSTGFVIHPRTVESTSAVVLACMPSIATIYPGDPVTVMATAGGLDPKLNAIYSWSGSGVTGSGETATVATNALAPGFQTVQVTVKEGKPGREGLKAWETATCSTGFTVKPFEPPTISCSANPTTIMPDGASTIASVAVSPQNRPLTLSYSTTAGTVSGNGTTAVFSSTGAPTGAVEITCNVSDDKGQSATANTKVTILPPPPPPQPHARAMCSLSFATDKLRPTRVDNEAKACLDQIALDLKQQADAKAVIVGESTPIERALTAKQQALAAKRRHATVEVYAVQRAVNAKDYLVTDQGIDASRISVATGAFDGETVRDYLVPAGANFSSDVPDTTPVDESTVKPEARKPLPERRPAPIKK